MAATMLIIMTMDLSILPSILSFILLVIVASRSFKSCLVKSVVSINRSWDVARTLACCCSIPALIRLLINLWVPKTVLPLDLSPAGRLPFCSFTPVRRLRDKAAMVSRSGFRARGFRGVLACHGVKHLIEGRFCPLPTIVDDGVPEHDCKDARSVPGGAAWDCNEGLTKKGLESCIFLTLLETL